MSFKIPNPFRRKKSVHYPGNLPAHKTDLKARLECLRLVRGNFAAVRDLFTLAKLGRLNIAGLFLRLAKGRALTPTQFYRYMNRY